MEPKRLSKAQHELELEALILEEQAEMIRLFAGQLGNVQSYTEARTLEKQTGAFDTRAPPPTVRRLYSDLEERRNERSM